MEAVDDAVDLRHRVRVVGERGASVGDGTPSAESLEDRQDPLGQQQLHVRDGAGRPFRPNGSTVHGA